MEEFFKPVFIFYLCTELPINSCVGKLHVLCILVYLFIWEILFMCSSMCVIVKIILETRLATCLIREIQHTCEHI